MSSQIIASSASTVVARALSEQERHEIDHELGMSL